MMRTHIHNGKIYTLSNENLVEGDKVFPISYGRTENGKWIHEEFDFGEWSTGFPDAPSTIEDLNNSDFKPYQIKTDYGFGAIEKYFKIINIEDEQLKNPI